MKILSSDSKPGYRKIIEKYDTLLIYNYKQCFYDKSIIRDSIRSMCLNFCTL